MVAVWWSVTGTLVVCLILVGLLVTLRPREAVHRIVSDHGFGPWIDVWHLTGRHFGPAVIGPVVQCFRALVAGIPVELVQEDDARPRLSRTSWLVAAQVPKGHAFTIDRAGQTGEVPAGCSDLVASSRARGLDAVLCGEGLLVVRVSDPRHLERALGLLVAWVARLTASGGHVR